MNITDIDISADPLLLAVDFGGDPLTIASVDAILINLDTFGRSGGAAALYATATPSGAAAAAIVNLAGKVSALQLNP